MNPEILHALLIATIFIIAFLGVGGRVVQAAGALAGPGDALRLSPVAAATGFGAYSYAAYPLIAIGSPPATMIAAVLLLGIAAGYRYWPALLSDVRTALRSEGVHLRAPLPLAFVALSVGFLLLASTRWFTPPSEGDALYGYLFNARWLYSRGFILSPYNTAYNLYPFNTELLFALTFAFGNDLIPKLLDGILGLFLLGSVYEFARRYADRLSSFFAAASLGIMTAYASTWASGKVDILCTLTLFSGISMLFLHSGRSTPGLIVSAFLVGTACAQKYTVWVFAAGFVLGLALLFHEASRGTRLRRMILASAVILACLVPHFTKTIAWTGNPVAPFGGSLFPSTVVAFNPNEASDATRLTVADIIALPVTLFFDTDLPRWPGPFPMLILLGLPLVWLFDAPAPVRRVAAFAALQLLLWLAVRGEQWLVPRFLLVPTALLLIASAKGVSLALREKPSLKPAFAVMMAVLLAYLGIWQNRDWRRSWSFVLGREDRAAWHDRLVPARSFGAIRAVAPLLGPNRRLFLTASLYYVPEAQLPYISTEREVIEFSLLPETERLEFLRTRCFGFVHVFDKVAKNPSWTAPLPVVAQWRDSAGGLEYTLFKIDAPCAPSDADVGERSSDRLFRAVPGAVAVKRVSESLSTRLLSPSR